MKIEADGTLHTSASDAFPRLCSAIVNASNISDSIDYEINTPHNAVGGDIPVQQNVYVLS